MWGLRGARSFEGDDSHPDRPPVAALLVVLGVGPACALAATATFRNSSERTIPQQGPRRLSVPGPGAGHDRTGYRRGGLAERRVAHAAAEPRRLAHGAGLARRLIKTIVFAASSDSAGQVG